MSITLYNNVTGCVKCVKKNCKKKCQCVRYNIPNSGYFYNRSPRITPPRQLWGNWIEATIYKWDVSGNTPWNPYIGKGYTNDLSGNIDNIITMPNSTLIIWDSGVLNPDPSGNDKQITYECPSGWGYLETIFPGVPARTYGWESGTIFNFNNTGENICFCHIWVVYEDPSGNEILNMWEVRNENQICSRKLCFKILRDALDGIGNTDSLFFITAKRQFYSSSLVKIPEEYWSAPVKSIGC